MMGVNNRWRFDTVKAATKRRVSKLTSDAKIEFRKEMKKQYNMSVMEHIRQYPISTVFGILFAIVLFLIYAAIWDYK